LPEHPNRNTDCYLNFPILLNGDRGAFIREMMKSGFDLSPYYYRNCADIKSFAEYRRELPNISNFVQKIVFFPVYPQVDSDYIDRLTKKACDLLTGMEHETPGCLHRHPRC
jgi:dTDP-4-amino-4,6-dideoxygalactose transaminase